jgi:hypothetical protein
MIDFQTVECQAVSAADDTEWNPDFFRVIRGPLKKGTALPKPVT